MICQEMFYLCNGMRMCFLPWSWCWWINNRGWYYESTDYIDILDHNLLEFVGTMFVDATIPFIFQHDNAPVHISPSVHRRLDEHDVKVIQWPAQSPDLKVIENIWSIGSCEITIDKIRTDTMPFTAWWDITPDYLRKLYSSMPRRVRHVIRSRGYPTKY